MTIDNSDIRRQLEHFEYEMNWTLYFQIRSPALFLLPRVGGRIVNQRPLEGVDFALIPGKISPWLRLYSLLLST